MVEDRNSDEEQRADDEESEPVIVGETELKQADFEQVWSSIPAFRKLRGYAIALPCVWGFGIVTSLWTAPVERDAPAILRMVLPTLFATALAMAFLRFAPRSWAKRAVADSGSGRTVFRFDGSGLHHESELRQAHIAWAAMPQYLETQGAFVIYTGSQSVTVIPKRAFDAESLSALGGLIRERIATVAAPGRSILKAVWLWGLVLLVFLLTWQFLSSETPRQPQRQAPESEQTD